ncbi:MAG: anthranilate phosphoribosyltransferase [Phycisphaerales bacterium]|nr:anthranilate phosphoribosyltransferase [Phycisphaerales bacterium]
MHTALSMLAAGRTLSEPEAFDAFETILAGEADDAQIAGLLSLIQLRGVTVDEIVGAARVMRSHVTAVPHHLSNVVDTCGTGGAPKTFNVSTAAAIIAAGAGAKVAKHGNRSRTGRGSAEILMQLGVNVDAPPDVQARCLEEAGICFSFAIHHHPAMKYAAGPRKSLGFQTMFNILGPLTNPAGARRQLIGVYQRELAQPMAEALLRLGAERAMVVHSDDGLDELSTTAVTHCVHVEAGDLRSETIDPTALGIAPPTNGLADLQATDLDDAKRRIDGILSGDDRFDHERDMACLNAAAALVLAGVADDLADGLDKARRAISESAALDILRRLVHVSHGR